MQSEDSSSKETTSMMDDREISIWAGGKLLITRKEAHAPSSQGELSEPWPHELNSVVRGFWMDQKWYLCQPQCTSHLTFFFFVNYIELPSLR